MSGGWFLIVFVALVYILANALYGVLQGCWRAFRAWRQFRDGRNAKIHEADQRLRRLP